MGVFVLHGLHRIFNGDWGWAFCFLRVRRVHRVDGWLAIYPSFLLFLFYSSCFTMDRGLMGLGVLYIHSNLTLPRLPCLMEV